MADPATQFQTPGIQATGFTPSEYRATPVNVPSEAGALWAQVGKTALEAAKQAGGMLQDSPLNPAVKEQMNYAINNYKLGETQNDYIRSLGPWGHLLVQTSPQGPTTISPGQITDPTMAARILQRMGIGIPAPPPPAPGPQDKQPDKTTPPQTVPETGGQGYSASWGASAAERAAPSTATKPKTTQPTTTNPGDLLVPGSASTDNAFLLRQMEQERQAAGLGGSQVAQQGTPSSMTFTNPATGNVQPLQTPSVFASRPAAPAPAAPTGQPQQPQPVSQTPAAASQADQAAMQQWQEQNAHPVMSSQDALAWMKSQTTLVQDATYLPNGGPGGSPAYAFHMKGGGMNIVPVSQMIQKGAGPMVAAQNTSAVLSKSDQLSGQRPGMTPIPSGTGAGATQGSPTSAPAGPQIAQQPPQGPPAAPGAYNASAYQMPQGPTITQAGDVNPALMAGGTNEQAAAAAKAQAPPGFDAPAPDLKGADQSGLKTYSMEELAKMDADPPVGNVAGLPFRQDRHDGRVYAAQRSPSSTLNEMRWYWGAPGFQDGPMDESTMRQTVRNMRDQHIPGFGKYTDEYTRTMPVPDLVAAVDLGNSYLATGGDPAGTMVNHIRGQINQSQSLTRLIDGIQAAQDAGISPSEYSYQAREQSKDAAARDAIMPKEIGPMIPFPGGLQTPPFDLPGGVHINPVKGLGANPIDEWRWVQGTVHNWGADYGQVHPLADALTREANYHTSQMRETPGLQYSAEGKPEQGQVPVSVYGISTNLKMPGDISPLDEVNRVFSNQPPDQVLADLKRVRDRTNKEIIQSGDTAARLNFRMPPEFTKPIEALKNRQDIADDTNPFREQGTNKLIMPDHLKGKNVAPGASPTPSPTPQMQTIDTTDSSAVDNFLKAHPEGGQVFNLQGKARMIRPRR
jgi:hypothetical protein